MFCLINSSSPGSYIGISPFSARRFSWIVIRANNAISQFSKTGAAYQTNVSGTDNRYLHNSFSPKKLTLFSRLGTGLRLIVTLANVKFQLRKRLEPKDRPNRLSVPLRIL